MHLQPKGKAYTNYREYMVETYGEEAVAEMELAHRKINRLEEQMLKNVIPAFLFICNKNTGEII